MAGNLTGPAFFGALLQEKNNPMSNTSRPVVLVLEDADASIVSRGINKAPHIAEILNLGDGIFGDVANIRIVATTNAKTVDVDDALLRPGRLCSHVKFDKLTPAHSKKVYKEICGKDLKEKGGFTLAEIYKMANENIVLEKKDEKVAGQYL
jgi:SpoVK/Ycf46/Vps4 family AAA+-type ATPase